jgi:hypothetical protein
LPDAIPGNYKVYQGELDVRSQIHLGGKGGYVGGADATMNYDNPGSPHVTFEDIDGLEVIEGPEGLYVILQEDSGNDYGERMFMASLEHNRNGAELDYYFLAMSGGVLNTRQVAGVGIPKGTSSGPGSHEFSGIFDISGFLHKNEDGAWTVAAADSGEMKRMADAMTPINDKNIIINLQLANQNAGIMSAFQSDRGGQIYLYKPDVPM